MTNSRNKGAAFEREVAAELAKLTGFGFKRNLEQYRERGLGDLQSDNPDWPFMIECKRAAAENGRRKQWKREALAQAEKACLFPCVIYRLDRKPLRVLVPLPTIMNFGLFDDCEWAELTLPGFWYVAQEIMEAAANEIPG